MRPSGSDRGRPGLLGRGPEGLKAEAAASGSCESGLPVCLEWRSKRRELMLYVGVTAFLERTWPTRDRTCFGNSMESLTDWPSESQHKNRIKIRHVTRLS
jgi:hypothetical protein